MKLRIAAICLSALALAVSPTFANGGIQVHETCAGATPTDADLPTGTSFFVQSNDFNLSACNNAMDGGLDVVSCFEVDTVGSFCQLGIAAEFVGCTDDTGAEGQCQGSLAIGIAGYQGTCSSSPGPCDSETGVGFASIEPVVSDGELFCVVVASPNSQQLISLTVTDLEGDCRLIPVELQSFEVTR